MEHKTLENLLHHHQQLYYQTLFPSPRSDRLQLFLTEKLQTEKGEGESPATKNVCILPNGSMKAISNQ